MLQGSELLCCDAEDRHHHCWVQGDVLLVCYVADVASKLQIHSLATGSQQRQVPLPAIGSITNFGGHREDSEFFFSFSSFTEPGATYRSGTVAQSTVQCSHCLPMIIHSVMCLFALPTACPAGQWWQLMHEILQGGGVHLP